MKNRNLFVTGLLSLGLLAACSNDELDNVNNQGTGEEGGAMTQIALSITGTNAMTRVEGNTGSEVYGEDAEYTVNDLLVVFANQAGVAQHIYRPDVDIKMKEATNSDTDDKVTRVTEPFSVAPGEYYVYVLANYKNSQDALTPIIANTTNMKTEFTISDASKLSTSGNFLMSNWTVPAKPTTIYATSDTNGDAFRKDEVDDDGKTATSDGETVQLLNIEIERVVAKVTFEAQSTTSWEVKNANNAGQKVADVTLNGVDIINLNKRMYMVVDKETAKITDPALKPVTGDWYYPEDPNYTGQNIGDATWRSNNFRQPEITDWSDWEGDSPKTFVTATYYCPENTMTAAEQQNGVTTGVVYKATWTPNSQNNAGYTTLSKDGTDNYSQKFKAVLELDAGTLDSRITENVFTTDDANGDFYTYAGLIFKNKNAACLYKAIVDFSNASDINTNFKTYADETNESTLETSYGIYKYAKGVCYYTVWIKHNPTSEVAMQQNKYGVVRNHWYDLEVTGISNLGSNKPTFDDPEDPDDPAEAKIQVVANIKQWTLVKQEVEL